MKITPAELQQIIKEESLRLKKRMMLESEKESILKRLQEIEECEAMEEGLFGKSPEQKAQIATDMIKKHPNYSKTSAFVAQQNNLDVNFVFQKLVEFLIGNGLAFPAGGVAWDNGKKVFVDKTIYKGTAPGFQGAAE